MCEASLLKKIIQSVSNIFEFVTSACGFDSLGSDFSTFVKPLILVLFWFVPVCVSRVARNPSLSLTVKLPVLWSWVLLHVGVTADPKINLRLQGQCWTVEAFGPCRRGNISLPQVNVSEGNSCQLVARHLPVRPWPRSIGRRIRWISVLHLSNPMQAVWLAWHLVSLPDWLQKRKARGMADVA